MSLHDDNHDTAFDFEFTRETREALSIPSTSSSGSNRLTTSSHSRTRTQSADRRGSSSHTLSGNNSVVSRLRTSQSRTQASLKSSGLNRPWTSSAMSIRSSDISVAAASTSMSTLRSNKLNALTAATTQRPATEVAQEIESEINSLIDQTVVLRKEGKLDEALACAKEGTRKEQLLRKHRKANSLPAPTTDLMHSTWFNLATAYEANDMPTEAIKTYSYLAKQRGNPFAGRIRINIGNVYYLQQKYPSAITQYKMALDICSSKRDDKSIAHKIRRNIGNAYFKMGKMHEAVKYYEDALDAVPDYQTGFNLLVCHLALGDISSVKKVFTTLVEIQPESPRDDMLTYQRQADELDTRLKEANHFLLTAARLIAPKLDSKDWSAGYEWVCTALDENHEELAIQMKLEEATEKLIKHKDFGAATKTLKSIQKRDKEVMAAKATNLSFVNFLEGNIEGAGKYADTAVEYDEYNAKALVNKGNVLFVNGDFTSAKELYTQANDIQADCLQAIFNLGLANAQLGLAEDAIHAFERAHRITPNDPQILYQIADIYELQGRSQDALKWFNVLAARVNDPGVLSRLGELYNETNDESRALNYQLESFRHYPIDLDVISAIGTFFVKQEMYERSLYFFQQASLIQPKEIKWGMILASNHKRCGNHDIAFQEYQKLHEKFPENEECLRCLVATCDDLNQSPFKYQDKLDRLLSVAGR